MTACRCFAVLWLMVMLQSGHADPNCSQDHQNFFLLEMIPHETSYGLKTIQAACIRELDKLQRLQFGPPTQWEIFNMMCKRSCRSYHDRWLRLHTQTLCDCTQIPTPDVWSTLTVLPVGSACLPSVTDLLCYTIGFCYDFDAYYPLYCDDSACGRQATNEDSWRHCTTHIFEQ